MLSHDSATEDDFIGEAYFDANCFFGDKSENLKTEWLQLKPKVLSSLLLKSNYHIFQIICISKIHVILTALIYYLINLN